MNSPTSFPDAHLGLVGRGRGLLSSLLRPFPRGTVPFPLKPPHGTLPALEDSALLRVRPGCEVKDLSAWSLAWLLVSVVCSETTIAAALTGPQGGQAGPDSGQGPWDP